MGQDAIFHGKEFILGEVDFVFATFFLKNEVAFALPNESHFMV